MNGLIQVGLHSPTRVRNFKNWLSSNGAQILQVTNEYEVLRFKAGDKTSVIYKNESGRKLSFTGQSLEAYEAFTENKSWRAIDKTKRTGRKPSVTTRTILARDGDLCFFCQEKLGDDITLEHLVAVTHGGPHHISNQFLAHVDCNRKAGHLSAVEKINIHMLAVKRKWCEK